LSFNITKTRLFSFSLFLIALIVVTFSAVNYFNNIHPHYFHIQDASLTIDKASEAITAAEKTACIEKAIQLYGQGSNLEKLQVLTSQNTTEEFQSVAEALNTEFYSYTFDPYVKPVGFEVFLVVGALYLASGAYKDWSETEKTAGFTFVVTLEIFVLVLFVF
jgi:hypothetical protein